MIHVIHLFHLHDIRKHQIMKVQAHSYPTQNPVVTRRAATRSRNDENAAPQQSVRTKPSISHLGPASKTAAVNVSVAAGKKPVAVKVGAKRTALGGVVVNGKEETEAGKKPCKFVNHSTYLCLVLTFRASEGEWQDCHRS